MVSCLPVANHTPLFDRKSPSSPQTPSKISSKVPACTQLWQLTEKKMDVQGIEPWTSRRQHRRCKACALPLCQTPADDELFIIYLR